MCCMFVSSVSSKTKSLFPVRGRWLVIVGLFGNLPCCLSLQQPLALASQSIAPSLHFYSFAAVRHSFSSKMPVQTRRSLLLLSRSSSNDTVNNKAVESENVIADTAKSSELTVDTTSANRSDDYINKFENKHFEDIDENAGFHDKTHTHKRIKTDDTVTATVSDMTTTSAATITPDSIEKRSKPRKRKTEEDAVENFETDTNVNITDVNLVTDKDSDDSVVKKRTRKTLKKQRIVRQAPKDWQETYALVEELRRDRTAPCDSMCGEDLRIPPKDYRFQVLISLILSSQTKDAIVCEAIKTMRENNVLSVDAIAKMEAPELNSYINRVGFHNNKTKFIMQVVKILQDEYDGDIPPTAEAMMKLPGVGPKMAYICETVAWKTQSGIGVDTHMHRLFNILNWVDAKTAEETRLQLQDWLPRDRWSKVNLIWVGFGQEVQQFKPKILLKALECSQPAAALRLLKKCGLDYMKEGKKLGLEDKIKSVLANKE